MKSYDIFLTFEGEDSQVANDFLCSIEAYARQKSSALNVYAVSAQVRENILATGLGMVGATMQASSGEMPASLQDIIDLVDED